jgi:chromosome segregation ATPase
MDLTLVFGTLFVVCAVVLMVVSANSRSAAKRLKDAETAKLGAETKLSTMRQEMGSLREDLLKKAKALDESRDAAKKKLRKEAQKGNRGEAAGDEDGLKQGGDDAATQELRKMISALEMQLAAMKTETQKEWNLEKIALLKEQATAVDNLNSKIAALEGEREKLTSLRQKRRKDLADLKIPVETLSDDVVDEMARLYRKAEQFEALNGMARGKLQLAQERYADLQKRYFAVCRELALGATNASVTDAAAASVSDDVIAEQAEAMVAISDSDHATLAAEVHAHPAHEGAEKHT